LPRRRLHLFVALPVVLFLLSLAWQRLSSMAAMYLVEQAGIDYAR